MAVVGPIDTASASVDCPDWVDSETATECIVSSLKSPGPGPWTFNKSLLVTSTGHIDGTASGLTLNINGAAGLDLIMEAGGVIETDDDNKPDPNAGASPITIVTSGSVEMAAGSRISADNLFQFGPGGNILMTIAGDMTMGGTPGLDNCAGPGPSDFGNPDLTPFVYTNPSLGAVVSAVRRGGTQQNVAPGGNITINVGNSAALPPVGVFTMERCSLVDVSSRGTAGEIVITAGNQGTIGGLVLSQAALKSIFGKGGGPITIITGCSLIVTDTGAISSWGRDPGADLVHLESCDVTVYGLVQSQVLRTGGHAAAFTAAANRCNNDPVAHPPRAWFDADRQYTGCVEIWAKNIVVDAAAHHGNINTDKILRNSGWIDLFAVGNITIAGGVPGSENWAVSSYMADGAPKQVGGLVTVKSVEGKVAMTGGQAIRANAETNGSKGGEIIVEAGGAGPNGVIALDGSILNANGGKAGGTAVGGTISVKSFNGDVTGAAPGLLTTSANNPAALGAITLTACGVVNYTGATNPASVNTNGVCGGSPVLPANAANKLAANAAIWANCAPPPCP